MGNDRGRRLQPIVAQGRNCWRIARADQRQRDRRCRRLLPHHRQPRWRRRSSASSSSAGTSTRASRSTPTNGARAKRSATSSFAWRTKSPSGRSISSSGISARSKQFFRPTAVVVASALVADQGDRLPLRRLAPARLQPPSEDRRDRRLPRRVRRASTSPPTRWDTPDHLDDDPHRTGPDGKPYGPWHDATMLMRGAGRRSARRAWPRAVEGRDRGRSSPRSSRATATGPTTCRRCSSDVDVAIARTRAAYDDLRRSARDRGAVRST